MGRQKARLAPGNVHHVMIDSDVEPPKPPTGHKEQLLWNQPSANPKITNSVSGSPLTDAALSKAGTGYGDATADDADVANVDSSKTLPSNQPHQERSGTGSTLSGATPPTPMRW